MKNLFIDRAAQRALATMKAELERLLKVTQ
jgi:hypothetical protein